LLLVISFAFQNKAAFLLLFPADCDAVLAFEMLSPYISLVMPTTTHPKRVSQCPNNISLSLSFSS